MDNVMDKIFKITYVGSYIIGGVLLLLHFIGFSIWWLIIGLLLTISVLFFLGYLIQEHLDHILQLYLIVMGIACILGFLFVKGLWASIQIILVGLVLIGIAFLFDEFFTNE